MNPNPTPTKHLLRADHLQKPSDGFGSSEPVDQQDRVESPPGGRANTVTEDDDLSPLSVQLG